MTQLTPRYWEVFFDVFEALPRQGPGNFASAARALALCRDLPPAPAILDLGCGGGGQTWHLAALTAGTIDALDGHAPLVERLTRAVAERGLAQRVRPIVGDMNQPPYAPGSFDLLWSEGALYNIGVEHGLRQWRAWLKPRGYLVFTEAVWRRSDPPDDVRAFWAQEYPQIADVAANLAIVERSDYELVGHFTLPDVAWWEDFYTPMEQRIALLRPQYSGDREALDALDLIAREVDLHRRFSDYYGYEFFVLRRRD